jgi:hypothetical protein
LCFNHRLSELSEKKLRGISEFSNDAAPVLSVMFTAVRKAAHPGQMTVSRGMLSDQIIVQLANTNMAFF